MTDRASSPETAAAPRCAGRASVYGGGRDHGTSSPSTWRPARAVPHARRARPVDARRSSRRPRDRRALRAGVARAAGRERDPRRGRGRPIRLRDSSFRPGHDEALLDDDESQLHCAARAASSPACRPIAALSTPYGLATASRTRTTARPARGPGALHRGPSSTSCSPASGCRPCAGVHERLLAIRRPASPTSPAARGARASPSRGYPKSASTASTRRGVDRGGAPPPGWQRPRGPRRVPPARRRRRGARRHLRPGLHPRGAARYVVPGRRPRGVRRTARRRRRVLVGDERMPDRSASPADEVERFYYGFSILHCLPVGMVGENAAGTGTVMRAERSALRRRRVRRFESSRSRTTSTASTSWPHRSRGAPGLSARTP